MANIYLRSFRIKIAVIPAILLLTLGCSSSKTEEMDLKGYFKDFSGGFCLYDVNTNKFSVYNPEHCKKRFSPCSTFKIPNSLIGLETGVIADSAFVIPYDSILHPKDPSMQNPPFKYWFQDLSLKQAFKYSCVWYYQELARRVGKERMLALVKDFNYGNMDISGEIDKFWLCGSLKISINEQIEFLRRLYFYKLNGISNRSIDIVKSIMLYEETPEYKLYGKTGGGDCFDNKVIGWYVGFVETRSGVKIFAMNILVNDFSDLDNNFRIELTKSVLRSMKII